MEKKLHRELLAEFKKYAGHGTQHSWNAGYLGTTHVSYHISNPIKRSIAKEFLKNHQDISAKEFTALLHLLFAGRSYDEKAFAGMLLGYVKNHRQQLNPLFLDSWLEHLVGWAEVDSLCQSNFTAEEVLAHWNTWQRMLTAFSKDKNVHKRRASLVLLTGPVSQSSDARLSAMAFKNIEYLKSEKDILITKAISWLLRSLTRHHKKEVAAYIKDNADTLPKIALRETKRKLLTGRK